MSICHRSSEKRRIYHEFRRQEEEVIGSLCRLGSRPSSPKSQLEQEKRIRREIANSNERRRMQSINAGFQSLRTLLPHHEGEKLSKAAILQHTSEFIYQLEQEKTRLLTQNCHLKRLLNNQANPDSDGSSLDSPLPKRKRPENLASNFGTNDKVYDVKKQWKAQAESSDEGIGNMSPSGKEPSMDDLRRELIELRVQLDRERRLRMVLEDQNQSLLQEPVMKPEKLRAVLTNNTQMEIMYQGSGTSEEMYSKEEESQDEILDSTLTDVAQEQNDVELQEQECHEGYKSISLMASGTDEIPEDLSAANKTILIANPSSEDDQCNNQLESTLPNNDSPMSLSISSPHRSSPSLIHTMANSVPILPGETCLKMELIGSEVSVSSFPSNSTNESIICMEMTAVQSPSTTPVTPQNLPRLYHASTSRQNLETIVEAIRHLEGDHLFCDDPKPTSSLESTEEAARSRSCTPVQNLATTVETTTIVTNGSEMQRSLCTIALPNGGHEYAIRQQVIHCSPSLLPSVGNTMRPGVIVSNHT